MRRLGSFVLLALLAPTASAADWPQWLGPNRDGSTAEKIPPWKGNLKPLWSENVGDGHSSPVVAGGTVFLHYAKAGKEVEVIEARAADSGNLIWQREYARPFFKAIFGRGPRGTPSVAGGKLYAFGVTGILTCVDVKNGDVKWQVDTRQKFKAPELKFGASTSPLVVGDQVIVQVGAKRASVVAFNKDTGDVVWQQLDDGASYASPIVKGSGKDREVDCLTQKGVVGLALDKGELLWRFPFEDKFAESSTTPVRVGDKLLVSSITLGTALLEFSQKDGKTAVGKAWLNPDLTCYFSTPVAVGKDHIYLVTGALALKPSSSLHCVDAASGKSLWHKDGVGQYHASLMRTGDDKLLMVEEAGNLVLIDPSPKEYRELCRADKICGKTWAHPAVADGKLYIRDEKKLVCVQVAP
jgi:outer membrane protein assembly factor BamB